MAMFGSRMGGWAGKSVWSVCDNLAQQVLSFVIFAVLARWLTPQEFGLLAIAHLMVQFIKVSLLDAIALPVVRAPQANDHLFNWLFTICTVVALVLACSMAAMSIPMSRWFGAPGLRNVLIGMSLAIVLFGLVRAHEARLLREGNFRLLAIRSLCSVGAGGAVALYLAAHGAGAMALVAQQLVIGSVGLAIALVAEWRVWRPRWVWSTSMLRERGAEISRVGMTALLNYGTNNGDSAIVSVVLGPYATGLYNLAKRALSAAYLIAGASFSRVSVTMFVQQQGDPVMLRRTYTRVIAVTLLALLPFYAITTLVAEPLVVTLFGAQWRSSASLFGWLSIAYVCQAIFGVGQNLSFITQHSQRAFKLALGQLVLSGGLAYVLSHSGLGMAGVAIGFATGSLTACIAMQIAINRQLALPTIAAALRNLSRRLIQRGPVPDKTTAAQGQRPL